MEATVVRLSSGERWSYLCGQSGAKEPIDLVVRAFEGPALCAVGDAERGPDSEPILVPVGQGRRLCGFHFYARPADPTRSSLITYRGL